MGFENSTVFLKACLVVLPIALLMQVIGFSTNYWVSKTDSNAGLWKFCSTLLGCYTYGDHPYFTTITLPGLYDYTKLKHV